VKILQSSLLKREGFEHGFGTRRSKGSDYPDDIHVLLQVHGQRIVILTGVSEGEKRGNGETGSKAISDDSISSSPLRPISLSKAEVVHMALPENHFRFSEGDAMVADIPGTAIGIRTADCLPILVGDTRTGAVAAIHCGWRSLALGLAGKGVMALLELTGSSPGDLVAALGPSIGQRCYEVGPEVKGSFPEAHLDAGLFDLREESLYMDLAAGAKTQMLSQGMTPDTIEEIVGCTSCDEDMFWSWRARRDEEERMVSWIRARER
jgi:YfiH family protein